MIAAPLPVDENARLAGAHARRARGVQQPIRAGLVQTGKRHRDLLFLGSPLRGLPLPEFRVNLAVQFVNICLIESLANR